MMLHLIALWLHLMWALFVNHCWVRLYFECNNIVCSSEQAAEHGNFFLHGLAALEI